MSENNRTGPGEKWRGLPEEEAVRRLIEDAGPRRVLPEDDFASIKDAMRGQWRLRYGASRLSRRPVRWWMSLAAAALLAAAGLVWWAGTREPRGVAAAAASLAQLTGVVKWEVEGEGTVEIAPDSVGRPVPAGSKLETGAASGKPGRLAVRMAGGASARLDAGTQVRLESATVIELERGAVYVDTGTGARKGEEVTIRTQEGVFEGIGTQFEIRTEPGEARTRLRVREGSVRMERREESVITDSGQELVVARDGRLSRRPAPTYGSDWDWVLKAAPMLAIEGRTVRTFLDWVARETGWRVELADEETTSLCDSTILHGSIDSLTPAEAPGVVLPSAGLGHRISEGVLFVYSAEQPARTPR
jgi:hypothetical protein